jgi:hypothetical protein
MIPLVLGGLGAVGGGLGAGALAGRYMPIVAKQAVRAVDKSKKQVSEKLANAAVGMDKYGAGGPGAIGAMASDVQNLLLKGADAALNVPTKSLVRGGALAGNIGAGALGATVGANVLGGIGQAMYPQQEAVDPESYGSSNSMGARYKPPTMQYV